MVNNNLIEALENLLAKTTELSKRLTAECVKDYNRGLEEGLRMAIKMTKEVIQ